LIPISISISISPYIHFRSKTRTRTRNSNCSCRFILLFVTRVVTLKMTSHNSTKNTTIANANANAVNMNSNAVNMKMNMTMNATRIHRLSKLLSVALLFFCQVETITASADEAAPAANANVNVNTNAGGFVSLKLTPRHVQLERRRRELHNADVDVNVDVDFDSAIEEQNRRRGEAVQVGALFEGYGTHYIDLWCGSPPQRQTVIVDTGSGVTAFPCSGCEQCGVPNYHIDRLFVEEESDTFHESTCTNGNDCIMQRSNCQGKTCKIGMSYAEGSRWNAYEAVDTCYVAGPHETPLVVVTSKDNDNNNLEGDDLDPRHAADLAFDMTFGCQTLVTGLFKTQLADGIMGMSNQKSTFWSQMFQAGKMGSDQRFALCFSRPPDITKEGTEAGAMTLGGCDERLHLTPMVYTSSFDRGRGSFFSVKVRKMMLRDGEYGESVQSINKNPNKGVTVLDIDEKVINKGGIIVDSGTTDTYWNLGISAEFKKVFLEKAGWAFSNSAIALTDEALAALPTILLQLYSDDATNGDFDAFHTPGLAGAMDTKNPTDVILAIPPSHYMEYNPDKATYTSRFYPTERGGSVLGANAIMGHDVFFDVDTKRIGWAESACDYTHIVQDNGYSFDIDGELKDVEEIGSGSGTGSATNDNVCEAIASGNKCQKIEGCSWGWGKCTTKFDTATVAPTTEETSSLTDDSWDTTQVDSPPGGKTSIFGMDVDEAAMKQTARDHGLQIGIFGTIATLVLCCCYGLWCRDGHGRSRSSGRLSPKYSRTALEPSNVEMGMTGNTTRNGGGASSSFQDEPDDDDNGDDDHSKHSNSNSMLSNGSRTSSQFRDDPDSEPEFEGDFA